MNHSVSFTIEAVSKAIDSLPDAQSTAEINSRYIWLTRAIEVNYIAECGREELAEELREFYAGRYAAIIGPELRALEDARQAEAEELLEWAYRLNEIADDPQLAKMFARDLGRDKGANGRVKGVTTRTGRTR